MRYNERMRWWVVFWIFVRWVLILGTLALAIVAIFFPRLPPNPPSGPCVTPINETCLPGLPSSKVTCNAELGQACIPNHLILDTLVVENLTTQTSTHVIENFQNITQIDTDLLNVNVSITCGADNILSANCFDISQKSCTAPLDNTCFPVKDVQQSVADSMESTSSTTYVDVPSMSLTAANAGFGRYLITANMQVSQSSASTTFFVIFNVNGMDLPLSQRSMQLESGKYNVVLFLDLVPMVPSGAIVKVKWKKSGTGSISTTNRHLIIQEL